MSRYLFLTCAAAIAMRLFIVKLRPKLNRNVRNNNPLNLKESAAWTGERLENNDKVFEEFISPAYGFRAGYIDLSNKLERGVNTIESIINVWAPKPKNANDEHNETEAYINYVSKALNISKTKKIEFKDLPRLMLAMSEFEGGKGYFTLEQAKQGEWLAKEESFIVDRLMRTQGYV